jgi:uncharacterized protein YdbL (DUF1318 family)
MNKNISFRQSSFIITLIFCAIFIWPTSVWAISLQTAKAQGLVGEQANGYLGVVKPDVSADVRALVGDINGQRKQKYQDIARRNNTSLQAVEALAGKKAMEKTPSGQFIKPPSTGWVRK